MNAEQEMQAMVIETDNPVRVRRFFMTISKFAAAYHASRSESTVASWAKAQV